MAVAMASLQRAATNPLARTAGSPSAAASSTLRGGVPSPVTTRPAIDPLAQARSDAENTAAAELARRSTQVDPWEKARRDATNSAATAEARTREANALQPYGVPTTSSTRPAAPSQPAAQPFDPYAEQNARRADELAASEAFQRQRALELQREEAAAAAEQERERLASEAFQMARARELQTPQGAQNDTHVLTADQGVADRQEGRHDAALDRESLFALVDEARNRGLLGPSSSSSSTTALSSLANAGGIAAPVSRVPHSDGGAASRAAFSTAKDRVGRLGRGAMNSLQRAISGRGLAGSSIEGREIGSLVDRSQGELADVVREQAGFDARRAADVDDRNYAGDVSQRNADVAAMTERARLALAERSQTQSETNSGFSNLQGLMSLIRRGRPAY